MLWCKFSYSLYAERILRFAEWHVILMTRKRQAKLIPSRKENENIHSLYFSENFGNLKILRSLTLQKTVIYKTYENLVP